MRRREERPLAGPVTVRIGNRSMSTDCVVGPPLSEPLIGRIVLAALTVRAGPRYCFFRFGNSFRDRGRK